MKTSCLAFSVVCNILNFAHSYSIKKFLWKNFDKLFFFFGFTFPLINSINYFIHTKMYNVELELVIKFTLLTFK